MKVASLLSLFISALFFSCQNSSSDRSYSKTNDDTLSYTVISINKRDKDCKQPEDCDLVNIRYHLFKDHPVLNDSVRKALLNVYPMQKPDSSIEKQVQHFMTEYESFKKEPYAAGRRYILQSSTKVLENTAGLLTLQVDSYTFTGGAHGASFTRFINYDTSRKKELTLDDVLVPGGRDSLNHVAEIIFRKDEGIDEKGTLPANTYFFTDDTFSINDNYTFTRQGIKFLYNQYEIKPYAAGKTELLVPYSDINTLLKPGVIITSLSSL